MKADLIKFSDLPLDLIRQKEEFVPEAATFLENNPATYTVGLYSDEGELIGAAWFIHDKLYNQLLADTIVIDEKERGVKPMREAYMLVHDMGMGIAQALGAKRVVGTTEYPRLMKRMFPNAKQESYVYYEEV